MKFRGKNIVFHRSEIIIQAVIVAEITKMKRKLEELSGHPTESSPRGQSDLGIILVPPLVGV